MLSGILSFVLLLTLTSVGMAQAVTDCDMACCGIPDTVTTPTINEGCCCCEDDSPCTVDNSEVDEPPARVLPVTQRLRNIVTINPAVHPADFVANNQNSFLLQRISTIENARNGPIFIQNQALLI